MNPEAKTTPSTPEKVRLSRREFLKPLGVSGIVVASSAGSGYLISRYLWRLFDEKIERDLQGSILHDHPLLENYMDFVTTQRQPVDYTQIIQNTRAVNFGENHEHFAPKDELSEHIPEFAELGFTHLGMEAFHSDFQPTLDEYFDTGKEREEVLMYIVRQVSLGGIVTELSMADGERYMQIVGAARNNNLRILGLDLPKDQFDRRREEINQAGDVQRRNELKQIFTDEREGNMSSVTARILKDPGTRMVNLTGRNHNHRLSTKLEETTGIKGTSVDFTGKEEVIYTGLFDYATQKAGLGDERFMVRITPEWREKLYSQKPYFRDRHLIFDDFLIHLPQSSQ